MDQALFNALGAGTNSFHMAALLVAHRLKVWLPELFGLVIGVGNVVAVLRGFAAYVTDAGHGIRGS
jgi:hypothetical protein